jgi:hypothetical protein
MSGRPPNSVWASRSAQRQAVARKRAVLDPVDPGVESVRMRATIRAATPSRTVPTCLLCGVAQGHCRSDNARLRRPECHSEACRQAKRDSVAIRVARGVTRPMIAAPVRIRDREAGNTGPGRASPTTPFRNSRASSPGPPYVRIRQPVRTCLTWLLDFRSPTLARHLPASVVARP